MPARLHLPLRVSPAGPLATTEQDSPTEVAQSVALLLATRPRERRSVSAYGTPDPLFTGLDPDTVTATITQWEPRADPALIDTVAAGDTQWATVWPAGGPDQEAFA